MPETINHGTETGFCPECADYHKFEIAEQQPPGVVGAFCVKCGFATVPEDLPEDERDAERRFPEEMGA